VTSELVVQAGHLLVSVVLAILILTAYRWVRLQSGVVAAVMAVGIVARAAIGVALFWISYLDLAILRDLHSGDGFWELAVDARSYYHAAVLAYFDGISAIPSGTPSPAFVQTLAGWMRLVGPSPASGLFLNLSLYTLLCVLVVRTCRPAANRQAQLACATCLVPFSIAPALLVHGTQPLKDEVFVFLIAITCLSVLTLLRTPNAAASRAGRLPVAVDALVGLGIAAYVIAGIRSYYAAIVLMCLALATIVYVWRARATNLPRAVAVAAACLIVAAAGPVWATKPLRSQVFASSPSYSSPTHVMPSAGPSKQSAGMKPNLSPTGLLLWDSARAQLHSARYRFVKSGGASNVVREPGGQAPIVRSTLVGLALILMPVSIVKALGWADFPGGRGLLLVTDIDTVLLDLSIIACLALLFVRRESIGPNAAYVLFVLALALVTGVLLSFVVTNFGTLFRLRLLMAAPLWMLPLATCYRAEAEGPNITQVVRTNTS